MSGNENRISDFYGQARQGSILGDEAFLDQHRTREKEVSKEHPRHECIKIRPGIEQVISRVAKTYGLVKTFTLVSEGKRTKPERSRCI
ncbi:hypothetical protein MNBD_NITROSPIRAE01-249 [hydrothermal vent metagenome]|uniref:Uncharacterized protein n=1 Tax=hydrothermal vent metagenome TaxID=652676 RepID=A0A3B1CRX0_9ZZZZ